LKEEENIEERTVHKTQRLRVCGGGEDIICAVG
jgi:hypothetical protein